MSNFKHTLIFASPYIWPQRTCTSLQVYESTIVHISVCCISQYLNTLNILACNTSVSNTWICLHCINQNTLYTSRMGIFRLFFVRLPKKNWSTAVLTIFSSIWSPSRFLDNGLASVPLVCSDINYTVCTHIPHGILFVQVIVLIGEILLEPSCGVGKCICLPVYIPTEASVLGSHGCLKVLENRFSGPGRCFLTLFGMCWKSADFLISLRNHLFFCGVQSLVVHSLCKVIQFCTK